MKNRSIRKHARLAGLGAALLAAALFSPNLLAQSCGADIDLATDPDTTVEGNELQFTGYPGFEEIVRISIIPQAPSGEESVTYDRIDYALACADNLSQIPCAAGNDVGANSGELPIEFAGNVGGTCGVTSGEENPGDLGPGTVRFDFPEPTQLLEGETCTVEFDVRVLDQGSDNSPNELTGAARSEGQCGDFLFGDAAGTVEILLEDAPPPPPPPPQSVPGPQGWWLALMALMLMGPAMVRIGRA